MIENDNITNAYRELRTYCDDLSASQTLCDKWIEKHPDWDSALYRADSEIYRLLELHYGGGYLGACPPSRDSTFDPDDPMPVDTNDKATVATIVNIMQVALAAYERGNDTYNTKETQK